MVRPGDVDEGDAPPERGSATWISRVLERAGAESGWGALVRGALIFGLPVDLLLLAFVARRGELLPGKVLFAYGMGVLLFNLTPWLIWTYDQRLLPRFFQEVETILRDRRLLDRLRTTWERAFRRRAAWFTLPLLVISVGNFLYARPFFREIGGIHGWTDPFYIAWFLVWGFWATAFGSYGLSAVWTTVGAIRETTDHPLEIDPLHPDRLGGLSCVGHFAISTTGLLSMASLFLPMLFLTAELAQVDVFLWVAFGLLVGSILTTFAYPTFVTYLKAKRIRDQRLEELRRKYYRLGGGLSTGAADRGEGPRGASDEVDLELVSLVHAEYQDLRATRVYPLDPTILVELVSSVALPLMFLFIEMWAQGVFS